MTNFEKTIDAKSIDEAKEKGFNLTKSQEKVLKNLSHDILVHDSYCSHPEKAEDSHEYKEYKISKFKNSPLVFLLTVVGMKKDEGTLASVIARTSRHIVIGKRGGTTLMNAKNKKENRGYFYAVHGLAE